VAALQLLAREPWVDPTKVVLVGFGLFSGGLTSLAAAAMLGPDSPPVLGVIDVSKWSESNVAEGICHDERLVTAMGDLGRGARVPALMAHITNKDFSDDLVRAMADAYTASGGPLEVAIAHSVDHDRVDVWWPIVVPFLARLGLPTADPPPGTFPESPLLHVPSNFNVNEAGVKAFEEYLKKDAFEKAFAVGARGGWGRAWGKRTMTDAMYDAVELCKSGGDASCLPYAVGNEYAPGVKDRGPLQWVRSWCGHGRRRPRWRCWIRTDEK
jgi:hypothetical protein